MTGLSDADRMAVADAVRSAETRTSAEMVCVVAAGASEYRFTPVLWSSVLALVAPWPLWWFTDMAVGSILVLQIVVFSAMLIVLSLKPLRLALTPRAIRRADVERAAARQFHLLGIRRTRRRAGMLLYVSLAERLAIVLPDEAAHVHLTLGVSEAAVLALTSNLRAGAAAKGFIAAIAILANALAEPLPPEPGSGNELPDALIEA